MSLANKSGEAKPYKVAFNVAVPWNSIWSGAASLEEKAIAVLPVTEGVLEVNDPDADIQITCVGINGDGQGGSGTGSADLKLAATLPAEVRNVDYSANEIHLVRTGLVAEVLATGGVGGRVQSDDVNGAAVYRIIISKVR